MLSENERQIKENMVSDLYDKAKFAFELDNFAYAIALFRNVLSIYPEFSQARHLYHLAIIHNQELHHSSIFVGIKNLPLYAFYVLQALTFDIFFKRWSHAIYSYERAFELNPSNKWPLFQIAHLSEKTGMDETAITVFEELTGFGYKTFECHKHLGLIYLKRKELRLSKKNIDKASSMNAFDKDVLHALKDLAALGTIEQGFWESEGDFTEKLKDKDLTEKLKKVQSRIDKETSDSITQSNEHVMAELQSILEKIKQAPTNILHLQKAKSLPLTHVQLAFLIAQYEKMIAGIPPSATSSAFLGDLHRKSLNWKEAETCYREAHKIHPAEETILLATECQLLQVKERLKDTPESPELQKHEVDLRIDILQRKLRLHPNEMHLRFECGQIYAHEKRYDEAIGEFQKSIEAPNLRTASLIGLGECFMQKGMNDLAIEQFERAMKAIPTMNETKKHILYQLSCIHIKLNNLDISKDFLKQIYQIDINYKDVALILEKLYKSSS